MESCAARREIRHCSKSVFHHNCNHTIIRENWCLPLGTLCEEMFSSASLSIQGFLGMRAKHSLHYHCRRWTITLRIMRHVEPFLA